MIKVVNLVNEEIDCKNFACLRILFRGLPGGVRGGARKAHRASPAARDKTGVSL